MTEIQEKTNTIQIHSDMNLISLNFF